MKKSSESLKLEVIRTVADIRRSTHLRINGSLVVCPYTPTTSDEDLGHLDLAVKVYMANVHPKFSYSGKKTQYLGYLPIGDTIDMRYPSGLLIYNWKGVFDIKEDKKGPSKNVQVKQLSKIAGGTGITPIMQLVRAVFCDPEDETCLSLLFANQTEEDILPRNELEEVQKKHPNMEKKTLFHKKVQ